MQLDKKKRGKALSTAYAKTKADDNLMNVQRFECESLLFVVSRIPFIRQNYRRQSQPVLPVRVRLYPICHLQKLHILPYQLYIKAQKNAP